MKLATTRTAAGTTRAARVEAGRHVDLGVGDVGELLVQEGWQERARNATAAVEAVGYAPVIPRPEKIICVGLNYRSHILEMGRELPAYPALFAKALTRLAGWARTGRENPMYGSPQQRTDEIDAGSALPAPQLRRWLRESAATLQAALDGLNEQQWAHEVVTAQGRLVPATELPWLRAREVMVHAVDLGVGLTFADLPPGFTAALVEDVPAKRSRSPGPPVMVTRADGMGSWRIGSPGMPVHVTGTLVGIAAWLTGRGATDVRTADGLAVPLLPAWL